MVGRQLPAHAEVELLIVIVITATPNRPDQVLKFVLNPGLRRIVVWVRVACHVPRVSLPGSTLTSDS